MKTKIDILKGIAPGKIIERELFKRKISQRELAEAVNEHYQTINAVILGKRKLTTELALKIERELTFEEGFLLVMQVYNDIKSIKKDSFEDTKAPNIREMLFWDTDFNSIDWNKHKRFVINRVLERGSTEEMKAIADFYHLEIQDLELFKYKNQYQIHALKANKK